MITIVPVLGISVVVFKTTITVAPVSDGIMEEGVNAVNAVIAPPNARAAIEAGVSYEVETVMTPQETAAAALVPMVTPVKVNC